MPDDVQMPSDSDGADPAVQAVPADTVEEKIADLEDLAEAREDAVTGPGPKPFWRRLGPGLITGAADDDPSGIGTYSVAGAQFGYTLFWLVPYLVVPMIVIQEMCGRLSLVTGRGLSAVLKIHYPRWILLGAVFLLFGANIINIYADLNAMAASAQMLFGHSFVAWLTLITMVIVGLQVFVPYHFYVRILKYLTLALVSYVVTVFLPSVPHHWDLAFKSLVLPHWSKDPAFLMTLVGFVGTTISPYLFFWQAGETVEEEIADGTEREPGRRRAPATAMEVRAVRGDTAIGMIASQLVAFFIMLCTTETLHARGITQINTAQDAAKALLPLGAAAYWLFTLGILGTGMLAIPTLAGSCAYAAAETMGWRYGLYRRFSRARSFYAVIALTTLAGFGLNFVQKIDPIKGLLYSAVLNAIVAPPLIVLLLLMCNNGKIVKEWRNRPFSNIVGWLTAGLMTLAAVYMIYGMIKGRS